MFNYRIASAVATAIAMTAGAAVAEAGVAWSTVPNPTSILFASGSTAIDPVLEAYFVNVVCDQDGNQQMWAGTAAPPGVASRKFVGVTCNLNGAPIGLIKEDNAGSLNGIVPVRDATPIAGTGGSAAFPDPSTLDANCANLVNGVQTCNTLYGTISQLSNIGFADEDAPIFGQLTTNAGNANLKVNPFQTVDLVFAPAVSLGFYHALQQIEGIAGVGSDTVANMPTLDWAWLNRIFVNDSTTWCSIANHTGSPSVNGTTPALCSGTTPTITVAFGNSNQNSASSPTCWNGLAGGGNITGCTTPASVLPRDAKVWICTRGLSSGSNKSASIFLENQYCASNTRTLVNAAQTSCTADGCGWAAAFTAAAIFQGNGTGDLLSCLEAHDQNGQFAIGYASTDNGWGPFQSNIARKDFRYTRVNGVAPTLQSASADRYRWWTQGVGYIPVGSSNTNIATLTAGTLATNLASGTGLQSVAAVKKVVKQYEGAADTYDTGAMAIPSATQLPNDPNLATGAAGFFANPVNSVTKFGSGATTNNCQPPVPFSIAPEGDAQYSVDNDPTWLSPVDIMPNF